MDIIGRKMTRATLKNISFLLAIAVSAGTAEAQDSAPFYIKHYSSQMYIHPKGGSATLGNYATFHPNKGPEIEFFFRPKEGDYGLIIHKQTGRILIPTGGRLESPNGTPIVFHEDTRPAAYFKFDPVSKQIQHKSGKFWHPAGGASLPESGHPIVLFDGSNETYTRFFAVDTKTDDLVAVMPKAALRVVGRPVGSWVYFCQPGGLQCRRKITASITTGDETTETRSLEVTKAIEKELNAGIEVKLGEKGVAKLGASVKTSSSVATSDAISIARSKSEAEGMEQEVDIDYTKFKVGVVWRWQVSTKFSDGRTVVIKTTSFACTEYAESPKYLPNTREAIDSCRTPR